MPVATEEVVKQPTKQEIEELKKEIRELLPHYHTRRLELGIKLIRLQDMLAHHGNGTFTKVATVELKIPHSTVYDLIDYAEAEIKRVERLSGKRTNADTDVDLSDPEEVAELLRRFEEEAERVNDVAYLRRKPKKAKQYIKMIQIKFILPASSRKRVARAWQILRQDEAAMKKLTWRIAREVVRAASGLKKTSDK